MTVRVVVVEDEVRAAEAHASYVARVPGFEVSDLESVRSARAKGHAAKWGHCKIISVPTPRSV